jgi:hypothetical protein
MKKKLSYIPLEEEHDSGEVPNIGNSKSNQNGVKALASAGKLIMNLQKPPV